MSGERSIGHAPAEEVVLYEAPDGDVRVDVRLAEVNCWDLVGQGAIRVNGHVNPCASSPVGKSPNPTLGAFPHTHSSVS